MLSNKSHLALATASIAEPANNLHCDALDFDIDYFFKMTADEGNEGDGHPDDQANIGSEEFKAETKGADVGLEVGGSMSIAESGVVTETNQNQVPGFDGRCNLGPTEEVKGHKENGTSSREIEIAQERSWKESKGNFENESVKEEIMIVTKDEQPNIKQEIEEIDVKNLGNEIHNNERKETPDTSRGENEITEKDQEIPEKDQEILAKDQAILAKDPVEKDTPKEDHVVKIEPDSDLVEAMISDVACTRQEASTNAKEDHEYSTLAKFEGKQLNRTIDNSVEGNVKVKHEVNDNNSREKDYIRSTNKESVANDDDHFTKSSKDTNAKQREIDEVERLKQKIKHRREMRKSSHNPVAQSESIQEHKDDSKLTDREKRGRNPDPREGRMRREETRRSSRSPPRDRNSRDRARKGESPHSDSRNGRDKAHRGSAPHSPHDRRRANSRDGSRVRGPVDSPPRGRVPPMDFRRGGLPAYRGGPPGPVDPYFRRGPPGRGHPGPGSAPGPRGDPYHRHAPEPYGRDPPSDFPYRRGDGDPRGPPHGDDEYDSFGRYVGPPAHGRHSPRGGPPYDEDLPPQNDRYYEDDSRGRSKRRHKKKKKKKKRHHASKSRSRSRSRSISSHSREQRGRHREHDNSSYSSRSHGRGLSPDGSSHSHAGRSASGSRRSRSNGHPRKPKSNEPAALHLDGRRDDPGLMRSASEGDDGSKKKRRSKRSRSRSHESRRRKHKSHDGEISDHDNVSSKDDKEEESDPSTKDQRTVFVSQLVMRTQQRDVKRFFKKIVGVKVKEISFLYEKRTGRHKGCAYVELARLEDIPKAVEFDSKVPDFQRFPILIKANEGGMMYDGSHLLSGAYDTGHRHASNQVVQNIYVGSVDRLVTPAQIEAIFAPFGVLTKVNMPLEPGTNEHRGYAFLSYTNAKHANLAIKTMQGQALAGRQL